MKLRERERILFTAGGGLGIRARSFQKKCPDEVLRELGGEHKPEPPDTHTERERERDIYICIGN